MNRTLLLFSRDPGGANQMIALHGLITGWWDDPAVRADPELKSLLDRIRPSAQAPRLLTIAKDFAIAPWQRSGQNFVDWNKVAGEDDPRSSIRKLLAENGVTAVLSATSDIDDETDIALWDVAAKHGVPVHIFVDQNTNVASRFSTKSGIIAHPDHIYVPDASARIPLEEIGLAGGIIHVVPELHLLRQRQQRTRDVGTIRRMIRAEWGIQNDRRIILFASENVAEMEIVGKKPLYSEFECLNRLIDSVAARGCIAGQQTTGDEIIVVRPHPKDRQGKYAAVIAAAPVPLITSMAGSAEEAILAADVVVGMRSMLLDEARALGLPVASLVDSQPIG